MRCVMIMDGQFTSRDGLPASHHMHYDAFFKEFLSGFDEVIVVGRQYATEDPTAKPVVGPGVSFIAIPGYRGPYEALTRIVEIAQILKGLIAPKTVFLLRVPGTIPFIFCIFSIFYKVPFSVQCVADPADQLGRGSVRHFLRPLFRAIFIRATRWACRHARVCWYVTSRTLQQSYPPGSATKHFGFTDLAMKDELFVERPKSAGAFESTVPTIVNVGMMVQMYKGQDVLIKAAKICVDRGLDFSVRLIGDGQYRAGLEHLTETLGLKDRVVFVGKLGAGDSIRSELDNCRIFALPSRQEGLPRALLEAMARGCPCISTAVGGIPELLEPADLVPADDPKALADAISNLLNSPEKLAKRADRNLEKSREYGVEHTGRLMIAFFHALATSCPA